MNGAFNKGRTGRRNNFQIELTAIPVTGSRSINQLQYNANAVGGSLVVRSD
jgi:hypothetical protein